MFQAVVPRAIPEVDPAWLARLREQESTIRESWERPTDAEWQSGVRHAVLPLLACCLLD